jgi:two-component system OmpR family sensor kinase
MRSLDPGSWPIRWRLTALNVGVLAATLLLLGGALLLQLDSALVGITADHLRDQARLALQGEGPRPPPAEFRRGPQPGFSLPRTGNGMVRRLSGPDTGVLVFDDGGTLVAASEPDEDVEAWPQPTAEQVSATLAGSQSSRVVSQQTRRTLVLLLPLRTSDGAVVGALGLARSLELTDQLEARLRIILAAGTVIALIVAGGLGLRATRAALRPLDCVIRAARGIGAGQLDERLRLKRRDEIGALADAFDAMLDRLAGVLAAQRRFVADAAHELRTPLTALGGMVEMLQLGADRGDRTTVRRMLDSMEREISRLGRLVADLLTLSRLDAEQPLALAALDLAPLVADVSHQTELLANGQQVQSLIQASPTVVGDADRLKQVLLNLTDNALKFTPPGGRIELRLDQLDGRARLAVADSGSGIAPDVLPRVTDRFVRGDASRSRATGGSGLGLAIAREIVKSHGGDIAIDSQPGRGTTVTISLPLARPDGRSGNAQPSEVSASERPSERKAGATHGLTNSAKGGE